MHTAATQHTAIRARLRRQLERQLWEAAETLAERHEELGRRIKLARDEKGWKQKELAAAVHVEPVTISRWETGRHAPDVGTLKRLAEALEKPATYFVAAPADDQPVTQPRLADVLERVEGLESSMEDVRQMVRAIQELLQAQIASEPG